MHNGRPGEIDETEIGEKCTGIGADGRAPDPVDENRIDERRQNDRAEHIGRERHALGNRARDDGRRRAAKHHLKDKETGKPAVEALQQEIVSIDAERKHTGAAESQHEADGGKANHAEDEIEQVLLGDIDGVF